jgi:hypothetical protein
MKGIPETNRLTLSVSDEGYSRNLEYPSSDTLKVKRLVSGIPFIRYAHSQTIGFWNTLHQIRSQSNDWFLEYPLSDTLTVKRLVSGIPFIRYAHSQTIGFWNTLYQIRSKSNDWFKGYTRNQSFDFERI